MKHVLIIFLFTSALFADFYKLWDEPARIYELYPKEFASNYYNETLQIWDKKEVEKIFSNSKGTCFKQDAIIVKNTSERAVPSNKPFFKNPKLNGEGYPFDYAQYSALYIGMPIKILKESKDRQWYFALTPANYGWVEKDAIAFVSKDTKDRINGLNLCTSLDDDLILENSNIKVGTVLPCDENNSYIPIKKENGFAKLLETQKLESIPVSEEIRIQTALKLLDKPYGWGGLYQNRDCSALTRDVFIPLGIYLKRNSKQQASPNKAGYIDLSKLSASEKKEYIAQNATPWRTLLYLPGHIVLYIGQENGEPLIYHAIWSMKIFDENDNENRYLIGKSIISTLDLYPDVSGYDSNKSSLAPKIVGMRTY